MVREVGARSAERASSVRSSKDSSHGRERERATSREEGRRLRNEGDVKSHHQHSSSTAQGKQGTGGTSATPARSGGSPLTKEKESAPAPAATQAKPEETAVQVDRKEAYEAVVDHENSVARALKVENALEEAQETETQFEENLQELLAMMANPPEDPEDFEEKTEDGMFLISTLRQINKFLKLKLKCVKEDQLAVRNTVDADHLLLQNLLYEATHLQNQVAAVKDYKGKDEKIDLIPVEQFYAEAPESIIRSEITKDSGHHLRVARLEYEFVQRQKLTDDCSALQKEMDSTNKAIDDTQQKLDSVKPMLESVLEATKPVQQFFGMDFSAKQEQNEIAQYLPPELHVLFVQSNAYKESRGKREDFCVRIRGNIDEAKELVVTPDEADEDSDSDKEKELEQENDVEISRRRRLMRKKSSVYCSPEEMKKKFLQKHPLRVEWIVQTDGNSAIFLQFFFLLKLKIVTVKAKTIENRKMSGIPEGILTTSSESVLEDLFPNDRGLESPNPANAFLFQKIDAQGIVDFIFETGRPFVWAQKLAGLQFPQDVDVSDLDEVRIRPKPSIATESIAGILKAIKLRQQNQTLLCDQLKQLESRNLQIPPEAKELFPTKLSTSFKNCEPMTFSSFSNYSFVKDGIRQGIVSEKATFYKAHFERGKVYATALIAIPPEFPQCAPTFFVQLEKDGNKRNATNDTSIRGLEYEINWSCVEEFQRWPEHLITLQLTKLMQCIDIILETDFHVGESAGPSEFSRDKLFLHAGVGRNLRRPFNYNRSGGGYFSQRF